MIALGRCLVKRIRVNKVSWYLFNQAMLSVDCIYAFASAKIRFAKDANCKFANVYSRPLIGWRSHPKMNMLSVSLLTLSCQQICNLQFSQNAVLPTHKRK